MNNPSLIYFGRFHPITIQCQRLTVQRHPLLHQSSFELFILTEVPQFQQNWSVAFLLDTPQLRQKEFEAAVRRGDEGEFAYDDVGCSVPQPRQKRSRGLAIVNPQ